MRIPLVFTYLESYFLLLERKKEQKEGEGVEGARKGNVYKKTLALAS